MRYHHTIRYVYFQLPATVHTSYTNHDKVTIRLMRLSQSGQDQEIERFYVDFANTRELTLETVKGEAMKQLVVEGRDGSLMIRFPEGDPTEPNLVYVYNRYTRNT